MYYAAACQTDFPAPRSRAEIASRTRRMIEMIEQTVIGYRPFFDVKLFAFPEFAHAVPIFETPQQLAAELAVELPNEHTEAYCKVAAKYGIHIQTGTFLELDRRFPAAVFNTTLLIGPDGILSKYRKLNPWIPWEVHASPHDFADYPDDPFPVVDTELGKLGVAICYDWLFPETLRELAFRGAEVLIRVSAYMDPWGTAQPMDWWTLINRTRALENTSYVLAANQGAQMAHYPPFSWPGGSMVVDYDGRILAQADPGPGEKVVVAPINIEALRQERRRRLGHDTRAHLRSSAHAYAQREYLPPAGSADISVAALQARIRTAKGRLP
ncbi:nitrilase-related carbon-nitrogen hydrolase [Pseudomarimonas arenosa]|uniref:Nitrilase n=1 Tax=Pseudomarimonas arenosa TaxID=2774145 RepID=A0AAW3ZMV1_9GAMM|nr:nitrilase-related carbon-nitrogen hydrolase [Pseudomarimonas arenosa]MBD8526494.1 nitrilase [Pseudomarimonas arenosa]